MALFEEFGHMGPCAYYFLVEMCAEKLEKRKNGAVTEEDCEFNFSSTLVRQNLHISQTRVRLLLDFCSTIGLLRYDVYEKFINIKMPKLLEYLDSDHKKPRLRRELTAIKTPLELELELDKELDKELDTITTTSKKSGVAISSQPRRSALTPVEFISVNELFAAFDQETLSAWSNLYPDAEYLKRQSIKAWEWYRANAVKRPKTLKGWRRALNHWFDSDWAKHLKTIPSNKAGQSFEEKNKGVFGND